jgi:hypothetical protein
MSASSATVRRCAFWAACFALLLGVRLCHHGVLWVDEAYGLAGARRILDGAVIYRDFWFDKPPLYAWIYLLWGAQTGWMLRLAGALFALLCCWLTARTASALFSPREGYIAAAAMAFYLSFDHPVAIMSLAPDLLLVPFCLASVWAIVSRRPALAGVIAALGLLAHPKAFLLLPLLIFWAPRQWMRIAAAFGVAAAGVWLLASGWREPVWEWGFLYSADTYFDHPFAEGLRRTFNWAGFHAALVIGTVVFFFRSEPHRWRYAVWLVLALSAVAAGARFFPRYYLVLLPVLAIAAARGLTLAGRGWIAAAMALALLVPAARFGARHVATLRGEPAAMRDLSLYEDCRQAAKAIRSHARRGDTLFVWGFRPELNVLAGLPGATGFLDSQPLTGVIADRHLSNSNPTAPLVAASNRQRLLLTRPVFIADGLGPLNPQLAITEFADLKPWLSQYGIVAKTQGVLIYRLREPQSR